MTKLSVIIPVYGVEKYLKEALDSVLNQTLKDIEIIIVDDGGKDTCPQIIDEYAQKDDRIIAVHKQNGGYGQSCNVGLEKATGEYVAILEPDDYIESSMYEDLFNVAIQNKADIVKSKFYCNVQSKNYSSCDEQKWVDEKIPKETFKIKDCPLFLSYHPSIWSCIYRREFLVKNNIKFVEAPGAGWTDNLFQVQTMCLAERIKYVPKAYYYWRVLNENPSDELKDYSLPFIRSIEINNWLKENKINDKNILFNLYERELNYIDIVMGMKNISSRLSDVINLLNKLFSTMDENVLLTHSFMGKTFIKKYLLIKQNPIRYYQKSQIKRLKRYLFYFKFKDYEKRLVIFGRTIWKG